MNTLEKVIESLNIMNHREFQNTVLQNSADVFGAKTENEFLATEEFWKIWNQDKDSIKNMGVRVYKDDDSGMWFVNLPNTTTKTETDTTETETTTETLTVKVEHLDWKKANREEFEMTPLVESNWSALEALGFTKFEGTRTLVTIPAGWTDKWEKETSRWVPIPA